MAAMANCDFFFLEEIGIINGGAFEVVVMPILQCFWMMAIVVMMATRWGDDDVVR